MMQIKSRYIKIIWICSLLISSSVPLCGFDFFSDSSVVMDTEKNIVYKALEADKVISDFKSEKGDTYDDQFFVVYGKAGSVDTKKGKEFVIKTFANSAGDIEAKVNDESVREVVKGLKEDDTIKAYGKVSTSFFSHDVSLEVHNVEKIKKEEVDNVPNDLYCTKSGTSVKKSDLVERNLNNGKIHYYIPTQWSSVEHNIIDEELGKLEGYQYRLNNIKQTDAYPESLFVCYSDETIAELNDRKDPELIEKAILRDIWGVDDLEKYPLREIKTYYGPLYKYYRDTIEPGGLGQIYNVEVIFQECNNGFLIYLYVYKDNHSFYLDNIMLLLRMIQS